MPDTTELSARCDPVSRAVDGPLTIDRIDQRTRPFRRYQAISGAVLCDLGGEENTSEIERQLISRFSVLALSLEGMEAAALAGDQLDLDLFARGAGHLRRIGETLGLKRRPRDLTPSLEAYAAMKRGTTAP